MQSNQKPKNSLPSKIPNRRMVNIEHFTKKAVEMVPVSKPSLNLGQLVAISLPRFWAADVICFGNY